MSAIEANITINLPDGVDPREFIKLIDSIVSSATNRQTEIHVMETDNPLTTSPIGPR